MLEKELRQLGNVGDMFSQGGHLDLDDEQAVVKVLAEGPLGNGLLEIPVRGGNHPHISIHGGPSADTFEWVPLERPKELGLDRGWHLADLVQKQRATIGLFELARLAISRPGEGPFLVTEQFAFEQ